MSERRSGIAILMLLLASSGDAATFRTLNRQPNEEWFPLAMRAISSDGQVAVGDGWTDLPRTGQHGPVMWSLSTGLVLLDGAGPFSENWDRATVSEVSADGSIISGTGVRDDNGEYEAFRWTRESGAVPIGTLSSTQSWPGPWVRAMTDNGAAIVGSSESPNGQEAFLWTAETGMRGLGDLPGGLFNSGICGMTPDAETLVGFANSERGWEAVRWTQSAGFTVLGEPATVATHISDDGQVIVGNTNSEAFRWTAESGLKGLGDLLPDGRVFSGVTDMTPDGSTIVGMSEIDLRNGETEESFVWDAAHGMRSLTDVAIRDYGLTEIIANGWAGHVAGVQGVSDDAKVFLGSDWIIDLRDGPRAGDTNFDGAIDLADFGILKQNFGIGVWRDQGDLDDNDRVDLSDFGILKANFGKGASAVPEPSTLFLATLALFALACRRPELLGVTAP
ncbi:MAG: PEP-CTERM sorting domain-containing protein [Pirellulales bacterium]